MKVYIVGFEFDILSVYLSKADAVARILRDLPDAVLDDEDYCSGYWVESWDVI
jgi:hypothetical protein